MVTLVVVAIKAGDDSEIGGDHEAGDDGDIGGGGVAGNDGDIGGGGVAGNDGDIGGGGGMAGDDGNNSGGGDVDVSNWLAHKSNPGSWLCNLGPHLAKSEFFGKTENWYPDTRRYKSKLLL